ncbi:HD domain-containing phosphohydrolase [Haliangium ochraceum]|uniref:Response regulator receiver modulated metal dependent phosphohydrolase n=1 Tax=Haliangium ochraceum (strain DSM 14365 / JCM 11303 / SMP-2) TaxID=502025 RepID=D0LNN3_HALO1|nr:HD domain-containing phosphohydrolase [Haliangium ochraceum]ACY16938.1 response regulator receiver modulated metal dependent phosphohydrolase [Haliangium ochraceum DSM 14365]
MITLSGDTSHRPADVSEAARILVVDDEQVIRDILSEFLSMEGYVVRSVDCGERALTELRLRPYDMVISDLKMPGISGLELLENIGTENIDVLTVIMTGFGTVETAITAMKKGAYDYILKPFKVEEVMHVVRRGLERQRLQAENIRLRESLTIFKVSEAIATSLDIDHVLDVILGAALDEVDADVASLHLKDPRGHRYDERIKRINPRSEVGDGIVLPVPDLSRVLLHFHQGTPILAHGIKANRYFNESIMNEALSSFTSVPLQVATRVIGMLNVYSFTRGKKFDEGNRKMLSVLASRAATAIENAHLYEDLRDKNAALSAANRSLEDNFQQTVAGFAMALEEADQYTGGHSMRVAEYAGLIARGLTLPDDEVARLIKSGTMHDIGKIGIPYDMINKPGRLTDEEIGIFRQHPDKGKRIMEPVPCMHGLIAGCWCHHEWYDGGGYPRGLSGDSIPLDGRIVAIADAYDAMTSDRAYRRALPHQFAIEEIRRCGGTQFDPEVAEVFLQVIEEHRQQARERGEDELLPP